MDAILADLLGCLGRMHWPFLKQVCDTREERKCSIGSREKMKNYRDLVCNTDT